MKYSICVSGAAAGETVKSAKTLAERLGVAIAKSGHMIVTGATVGLPYYAAKAAKEADGMSIGFSPADSLREHMYKYRLPLGVYDFVSFTGMHYVGRDVFLIQSCDAVITVGGRFGSLHEFTTAFEKGKPCGILLGSGGTADLIPDILDRIKERPKGIIIMDSDPERLVRKMVAALDKDLADVNARAYVQQWFLDEQKESSVHAG